MKIFRLLCLLIIVEVITIPCHAKKSINFGGKWNHIKKSIIQEFPVEAWVEDNNCLSVSFCDLKIVHVIITESSGKIIYDKYVDVTSMTFLFIPFDEVTETDYLICVTDDSFTVYGRFDFYK